VSAFEEIVVEGIGGPLARPPQPTLRIRPNVPSSPPAGTREDFVPPREQIAPPRQAFVPPPVPPQLMPEIIVKGKAPPRPAFAGAGSAAVRFNLATFFATVGGFLVSNILRDVSQARLDEAGRIATEPVLAPPDSPLRVMQPEPLTEIVVTAQRIQPETLLRRLPMPPPLITPDFDPFIMVPFVPRELPRPATLPVEAVPAPQIPSPTRSPINVPQTRPATIPTRRRIARPSVRPSIQPGTAPQVAPAPTPFASPIPSVSPATQPATRPTVRPSVAPSTGIEALTNPLTDFRRRLVESTRSERRAQLQTQVATAQSECPPPPQCKKDEELEKPRDRCFKQLVKQGLFQSMDRTYDWEEIDCITGRPI
jgi:hypothetical protein